jgi:hypothetical protein
LADPGAFPDTHEGWLRRCAGNAGTRLAHHAPVAKAEFGASWKRWLEWAKLGEVP